MKTCTPFFNKTRLLLLGPLAYLHGFPSTSHWWFIWGDSGRSLTGVVMFRMSTKRVHIVCMICNSLVDFFYVSHELYALKGISTLYCKSYGISVNRMIFAGVAILEKMFDVFQNTFTVNFLLGGLPAA